MACLSVHDLVDFVDFLDLVMDAALYPTQTELASRLCHFLGEGPLANCSSSQSLEFLGTGKTVSTSVSLVIVAVIYSVPLPCYDRSGVYVMP